jgi:hypothetical protein
LPLLIYFFSFWWSIYQFSWRKKCNLCVIRQFIPGVMKWSLEKFDFMRTNFLLCAILTNFLYQFHKPTCKSFCHNLSRGISVFYCLSNLYNLYLSIFMWIMSCLNRILDCDKLLLLLGMDEWHRDKCHDSRMELTQCYGISKQLFFWCCLIKILPMFKVYIPFPSNLQFLNLYSLSWL